ncbi:outer membrane protein [Candidatus Tisiphia endosymbiont of Xenochironomus xenolabis]|uniref:outer membrane protein n=1 Tax=unclassified Candidatus Tisiphia TaxID=2996318 RepID=UPI0035C88925
MKKLLLVAATSTAFLTSTASFAETGRFYLKAEGGASKLSTINWEYADVSLKLKSSISGIFGAGVGYYLMDNVRAELTLSILANPEHRGSFNGVFIFEKPKFNEYKISETTKIKSRVKSLLLSGYVDLYDAGGIAKIFVGAGVGMAKVQEKRVCTATATNEKGKSETIVFSISSKNANNFAYQLTAGVSFNLVNGIKLDFAYSWRDYGQTSSKGNDKDDPKLYKSAYRGHNLMTGIRFDI